MDGFSETVAIRMSWSAFSNKETKKNKKKDGGFIPDSSVNTLAKIIVHVKSSVISPDYRQSSLTTFKCAKRLSQ